MAVSDSLYNVYLKAEQKWNVACTDFEEHFTWLEEVVVEARQTFLTADPTLLPKTPGVKRAKQKKRPLQPVLTDLSESPPSKRVSLEDSSNKENATTPVEAPRRGRAAARAAITKTRQLVQQANNKKLRRPSTPEDPRKKKTQSTSIESPGKKSRVQVQVQEKTPKKQVEKIQNEEKSQFEMEDAKTEITSCKSPSKSFKTEDLSRISPDTNVEKVPKNKCTPEKSISDKEEDVAPEVSVPDSPQYDLRLEDSEENKSDEGKETDNATDDEVFENMEVEPENKSASLVVRQDTSSIGTLGEPEDSVEKKSSISDKPPASIISPKSHTSSTSQTALCLSSTSDENEAQVNGVAAPSPVPKPRSTRTKQKVDAHFGSNTDEANIQMLPPKDLPKARVTRTKTRTKEPAMSESNKTDSSEEEATSVKPVSNPDEMPKRSTRTKAKQAEVEKQEVEVIQISDSPKSRSTRTKKRQITEQVAEQPTRSTRTKRKKVEESESVAPEPQNSSLHLTLSDSEGEENESPEDHENMNATYVKPELEPKKTKRNKSVDSVSSEASVESSASTASFASAKSGHSVVSVSTNSGPQATRRVTRSKVRQLPVVNASPKASIKKVVSPAKTSTQGTPGKSGFTRGCCTPKSESGTPQGSRLHQVEPHARSPVKYSPRPFASKKTTSSVRGMALAYQNYVGESLNEIEEVVLSPVRVTRHSRGNATKRESLARRSARKSLKRAKEIARTAGLRNADIQNEKTPEARAKSNTVKTPSPTDKVVRPKLGNWQSGSSTHGSSGRITPKTFSRIRPTLASSNEYPKMQKKIGTPTEINRTKAIMTASACTPNEAKRTKNIVSGVTSFIKVMPSKPTREEIEEKKHMELIKKKEREEESRKKKEELLKSKAEDQKRRNEERMRRVQEAREERERKAVEAKEQQERDRKLREERLKEDQYRKKQQLLAKKRAEEEARIRKIKEQQEEEERRRQQEEERRLEEQRRLEEARKAEEERRAHLAEQKRAQDEEKKKRIAEAERILRERKEMEKIRLREAERLAQLKKDAAAAKGMKSALNDTYTTNDNKENSSNHNGTFTKANDTNGDGKERSNSYEMTPDTKKPKKLVTANNYAIDDIKSDDSTDDECAPKKRIPAWAQGSQLKLSLINQEYYPPNTDGIFPREELLTMPDLSQIFTVQRRRFFKRTSSAIWNTPPSKLFESY